MTLALSILLLVPAAAPEFEVHAGSADPLRGPLLKLEPDLSVTLGGAKPVRVAGAELVWLRRAAVRLPARPAGPQVLLVNGDCLPGEAVDLVNDRLRFRTSLGELTLPLSALSALWLAPPASREQSAVIHRLLSGPRNRDFIWLKNGDVLEGTILGLDAEDLTLDVAGKSVKVERARLSAIGFNTELARLDLPKQPFAHLTLLDGARVSLKSATLAGQTLIGQAVFDGTIKTPLLQVAALDLAGGRSVHLGDLPVQLYQETPFFEGTRWGFRLDRSVAGHELRLAGNAFDRGVGMYSASRLAWKLDGQYRVFECLVGLDETGGRRGRAQVEVLVDGKPHPLGWNGDLKPGAAHRVRLDVRGAKTLTLVVDFGADALDVDDQVNWADARLIR